MSKKAAKKTKRAKDANPYKIAVRNGSQTIRYDDATKVHPSLKSFFCYCLHKVALQHKNQLEQAIDIFNLQTIHLGVLRVIAGNHVNQNQLSEQLGIDKASTVKIIDRLEEEKVIVRQQCPEDRRVNYLKITPKGEKSLELAVETANKVEKEFLKDLSDSEIKVLKDVLQRLVN